MWVDIDIYKGARRVAPFVHPLEKGKPVQSLKYETRSFKPAYIKINKTITAEDMDERVMGENIYNPSPAGVEYATKKMAREVMDCMQQKERRIEIMARDALFDGVVNVVGDGINATIDYQRDAAHDITLLGTSQWDDVDADILGDLLDWKTLIFRNSGMVPRTVYMGTGALKNALKNDEFKSFLHLLNLKLAEVVTDDSLLMRDGLTFYGQVHGMNIFTYDEWYIDPTDGVEKPMIPDNEVLVVGEGAETQNELAYGLIKDFQSSLATSSDFIKSKFNFNPSWIEILYQSSPLVLLKRPDVAVRAVVF
jgi:hypothetical protein